MYPILLGLFLTSVISIILIKFVFVNTKELWQYGFEFGEIVYDLSIGYIVSYVFYYLVVFLKDVQDKKNVNLRVSSQAALIVIYGYDIYRYLLQSGNNSKNIEIHIGIKQLGKICEAVDPFICPLKINNGINMTWFELLKRQKKEFEVSLKKIHQLLPYLDSELVGIIVRIEDSQLFYSLDYQILPVDRQTSSWKDLKNFEAAFVEFFMIILDLETYCNKYFSEYKNHLDVINEKKTLGLK